MYLSPKQWNKCGANAAQLQPSPVPQKEEAPYEYCDELFQDVKPKPKRTEVPLEQSTPMKKFPEVRSDDQENVFARCHHHLHAINTCVDYQQTIKDEMKKLAKLEHAIFQKTSSHAQRLSHIGSTLSPEQDSDWVGWVRGELDALADQVAHKAQVHHKNAITLSSQCSALQHALDSHHELMSSLQGRSSHAFSLSPTSVMAGVGLPGSMRRSASPRKITTLAGINVIDGQEALPPPGQGSPHPFLSPGRASAKSPEGACKEAADERVADGSDAERSGMSFLHAYCLFEDIRKPRLVLANKIEYLRSQQISICRQLHDEDNTIMCLRETTQDKNRPWYAQVRLEESMSLKEFLGEHGRELEDHMSEAVSSLEIFDVQHRDKLADILRVFATHRIGHYENLKRTLMLMKSVFHRDRSKSLVVSEEHKQDGAESDQVTASTAWMAIENNVFSVDSDTSRPVEENRSAEWWTRYDCASDVSPVKSSKHKKCQGAVKEPEVVRGVDHNVHHHVRNGDRPRSAKNNPNVDPVGNVDIFTSGEPVKYIQPSKTLTVHETPTPTKRMVHSSSEQVMSKGENVKYMVSRAASCNLDNVVFSNEPDYVESFPRQESIHTQVNMPSPNSKKKPLSKRDFGNSTKSSALVFDVKTLPDFVSREQKAEGCESLESVNSESLIGVDFERSSSVDGPFYKPRQLPRESYSANRATATEGGKGLRGGGGVNRQVYRFGKSSGDREFINSSSVDWTNNHEMAIISKYLPQETCVPLDDVTKRETSEGTASKHGDSTRRTAAKNDCLQFTDSQLAMMNRLEQQLEREDSDLKAMEYIGKYATKPRRSSSVGRDRATGKFTFRAADIIGHNEPLDGAQRNSNNADILRWERACNPRHGIGELPKPREFSKDLEFGGFSFDKRSSCRQTPTPSTGSVSALHGGNVDERPGSVKIFDNLDKEDDGARRESAGAEPEEEEEESSGRTESECKTSHGNSSPSRRANGRSSSASKTSSPNSLRPHENLGQRVDDRRGGKSEEAFATSDESDWETESMSTLTSASLSSSQFPPQTQNSSRSKPHPSAGQDKSKKPASDSKANCDSQNRDDAWSSPSATPKSAKRVRFDDNLHFDLPKDW